MRVYTLALSLIAHVALFGLVVVVPLVATDVLPTPRGILEFVHVIPVIPEPPPAVRPREQTRPAAPSTAAPVEPPREIVPEVEPAAPEVFDVGPSLVDGVTLEGAMIAAEPIPPPPPLRERDPVRVGGMITRPQRVHDVPPLYPPLARVAQIEGTVILEAVIGTDGAVREVRVLRSVQLLDDAAMDTVRQWRFTPTLLNGEPVPVVMTVTVTFTLR